MTIKERIFQSLLLEVLAVGITVLAATFVVDNDTSHLTGLALVISLVAMVFNYFYNVAFDRIFGEERITRGVWMRIGHGLGFEAGMIMVTTPLLMFALEMDFWTVLMMDLVMVVFFFVFVIVFNWCYDHIRARYFVPPNRHYKAL